MSLTQQSMVIASVGCAQIPKTSDAITSINLKFELAWTDQFGSGFSMTATDSVTLSKDPGINGLPPSGTFQLVSGGTCCAEELTLYANFPSSWGTNTLDLSGVPANCIAVGCPTPDGAFANTFAYGGLSSGVQFEVWNCCLAFFFSTQTAVPWNIVCDATGSFCGGPGGLIIDLSTKTTKDLMGSTFTGTQTDSGGNTAKATLKFS